MRGVILIIGCLLLAACGGGGGGGSDDSGASNNATQNGSTNTGTALFRALDDELATRTVNTMDPAGLWIFYAEGENRLVSTLAGTTLDREQTVNLFAFLVSVYVLDNAGSPMIALNNCTGGYNANALFAGGVQTTGSFSQLAIDLQKLRQMAGSLYPFDPGDALLDAGYQAYLDTEVTATITDNREITFPASFTFSDTDGDLQGEMSVTFKARKIFDDFNQDIGDFVVNSVTRKTHCLSFLNLFQEEESESESMGQTTTIETDAMQEKLQISSWPSSADGISSYLNQYQGGFTSIINGQAASPTAPVTAVSMLNTAGQFTTTNVNSSLPSHTVEVSYDFDPVSGLTLDYRIDAGIGALAGSIEALY